SPRRPPRRRRAAHGSADSSARRRSWSLDPADGPEVAPGRALAAQRVVADVALPHPLGGGGRRAARRLDDAPERLLVEVVVRDIAWERLGLGAAHEAARLAGSRERAVQA